MDSKYKIVDDDHERFNQVGVLIKSRNVSKKEGSILHMHDINFDDGETETFFSYQIEKHRRKLLFLDIDGVCNSEEYMTSGRHIKGTTLGIDPFPAVLVKMIVQDTGCEVVLSSTWRLYEDGREDVRREIVDFIDVTPNLWGTKDGEKMYRGHEIEKWLEDNNATDARYAILDDDMDMLAYQAPNFFRTRWKEGLTREIAKAVTEHLNG